MESNPIGGRTPRIGTLLIILIYFRTSSVQKMCFSALPRYFLIDAFVQVMVVEISRVV